MTVLHLIAALFAGIIVVFGGILVAVIMATLFFPKEGDDR